MSSWARLLLLPLGALGGACVVHLPRDPAPHEHAHRSIAFTPLAPTPVGPYSQAVRQGATLYLSGQIGVDPASNRLVEGGVAAQTRQALANLDAILASEGFRLADVVEVQVFLAEIDDFAAMNAVYAETFASPQPARTTVAVAALPLGAAVEVRAVAVRDR